MQRTFLSFLLLFSAPVFGASVTYSLTQGLGPNAPVLNQFTTPDFITNIPALANNSFVVPITGQSFCNSCPNNSSARYDGLRFNYVPNTGMVNIVDSYFDIVENQTVTQYVSVFSVSVLGQVGSYSPAPVPSPAASLIVSQREDPVTFMPEPSSFGLILLPVTAAGLLRWKNRKRHGHRTQAIANT